MIKRRSFKTEEPDEWEIEILRALRKAKPGDYGNLSKDGAFFRLRYLTTMQAPMPVINRMVKEGKITLGDNNYFKIRENHETGITGTN